MVSFTEIVNDIKKLKIQGASNVAKFSVKALEIVSLDYKNRNKAYQVHILNKAKKILFNTRPTEPAMRNALNFIIFDIETEKNIYETVKKRAEKVKDFFDSSENLISSIGSKKIFNKNIIFTHCHSSSVINILKKAKQENKRFIVHNTETRPMFQGRITAKKLSAMGIPVVHYIDSAARLALKKADIMLIGADAITSEGKVINKIGSEMFAEIADKYDVPVYVCSNSWKFDPESVFGYEEEIESRNEKEVWVDAPKGVRISNEAFEKIDPDLVTGIISEIGVYKPEIFVEEVKKLYKWMF